MKRHLPAAVMAVAIAFLLLGPALASAQDEPEPLSARRGAWIGLLGGLFMPSDPVFKDVYGSSGLSLGLVAGLDLVRSGGFTLAADLDVRRFAVSGSSTITAVPARLRLVPISAGLEAHFRRGWLGFWLGGGAGPTFYAEDSEWAESRGTAFGWHLAGGLALEPEAGLGLRVYGRWSTASKTMEGFSVEMGGLELGAVLLYRFGR